MNAPSILVKISKAHIKEWLIFSVIALISGWLLEKLEIPAGLLLGPMLCAIVMGIRGIHIRMPRIGFTLAQGFIGCLIAHTLSLSILLDILKAWPIMLVATLVTILLSVFVGILSVRYGGLPGSTAAWGISPGGASAMIVLAEEYGADSRVVATMQYTRVICVVLMAALISHIFIGGNTANMKAVATTIAWEHCIFVNFLLTLVIILIGFLLGRFIPSGYLLIPMILGGFFQVIGWVDLVLPHSLLVIAYAIMGAYIGLRFDREILRYVMYAMPVIIGSSMLLIILCGISAIGVCYWLGTDYLSAYLATSPGGLDSLSIIAIDVHAEVGIVVAMQTLRLFAVVITGPMIAKYTARFALV